MLKINAVSVHFGAVRALDNVSLTIEPNTTLGLIGPNGSGKTTLLNAITGVYPLASGQILWRGQAIHNHPPHWIARQGIARTFQNLRFFPRSSVLENVKAAQLFPQRDQATPPSAESLLDAVGLAHQADNLVDALPLPDRRRLELARALAADPDLLLLDEPSGGMTPVEMTEMAALIQQLALGKRTCIIIEHKMALITALCDHVCVLNLGQKIAEGSPADVLTMPVVLDAYLGHEDTQEAADAPSP